MRRASLVITAVVAVFAAGALATAFARRESTPVGVDHVFVVPAGTADVLARGGVVEILPRDLEVRVGDRLVVVNDDATAHEVGPWTVRPDSTFRFRFRQVGRYDSRCSLHQGAGRFFIDVLPAA